jgi:hypothetical protein
MRRWAGVLGAFFASATLGLAAMSVSAPRSAAEGEAPPVVKIGDEPAAALEFGVTPHVLSGDRRVPARLKLGAEVEGVAGIPPGLATMTFALDRSIEFEPSGLPVCRWPTVQFHLQVEAAEAPGECPRAMVGYGDARIMFAFPESKPIIVPAPVTAYNGGIVDGALELLIEMQVAQPLDGAVKLVAPIRHSDRGWIGSEMTIQMPTLSEGAGMLMELQLELGRHFRDEGRSAAFVTARCRHGKLAASLSAAMTDGTSFASESIRACGR